MYEWFNGGDVQSIDSPVDGSLECFPCLSLDVDGCYLVFVRVVAVVVVVIGLLLLQETPFGGWDVSSDVFTW